MTKRITVIPNPDSPSVAANVEANLAQVSNDRRRLMVYDRIREAHKIVQQLGGFVLGSWERNAIEALDGVMYLTESVFSKQDQ